MKNKTLNIILAAIAFSTVATIIVSKLSASHFEVFPICVSYTAIAMLAILTMSDNPRELKDYSSR